jgi:mycothiol system anti-sigma-R factor
MSHLPNPFLSASGKRATCMEMLQLILDGQATDEQSQYFQAHMDHCMPCFKSYQLDMSIKELLRTKCCGGEAPKELAEKIKDQISKSL